MKFQAAIKNAHQSLKNHKIKSALIDSELLMAKVINKSREYVVLNLNKEISKEDFHNFQNLINQRSEGKPMAHFMNKKFFWKYEFFVNKFVLIPRPDTELIIEQVLKIYKNKNKISILDIGSGSGCIMLSLLKERRDFRATGVDICNNALKVSKINANNLGVSSRVKLYNSDIDKFYIGKYDLIISNPPYIKKLDFNYLSGDVIKSEPRLALDGGIDGLSEIRKFIKKSSELIKKRGKLFLEISHDQKNEVKKILNDKGFYIKEMVKDFAKNDRCIISVKI